MVREGIATFFKCWGSTLLSLSEQESDTVGMGNNFSPQTWCSLCYHSIEDLLSLKPKS